MTTPLTILKSIGVIVLGFGVVFLVNLPHDWLINSVQPGTVQQGVPLTATAEIISLGIIFLAGAAAGLVVYLTGGAHRKNLLLVLTGLFLLSDLLAVVGPLAGTSLGYRIMAVLLVPLEVWVGYRLANWLTRNHGRSATLLGS